MTTPTNPPDELELMPLAEIRALLEQTAGASAENTRAIAAMRAAQEERAARHDREMAEIRAAQSRTEKIVAENSIAISEVRAAIAELHASQERFDRRFERMMTSHRRTRDRVAEIDEELIWTSNDVSTLKGWGMEFLCERRPGLFADALNLSSIEALSQMDIREMAVAAARRGIIHGSDVADLYSADVFFYGRRAEDDIPVYLIVQASFAVSRRDVKRAAAQAETLETILRHDGPPEETGIALPVVAGTRLRTDPDTGAVMVSLRDVTYVEIKNGNDLTA